MLRGVAQRSLKLHTSKLPHRYMSSDGEPGGRRIGRKLFWLATGTLATTGGVLIYASKDEGLRTLIETNVPHSKPAIDFAGTVGDVAVDNYKTLKNSDFSMPNIHMPEISWPKMPDISWPQLSMPKMPELSMPKMPQISLPAWLKDLVPGRGTKEVTEALASEPADKQLPFTRKPKKSVDILLSVAVSEIGNATRETKDYIDALLDDAMGKNVVVISPGKDEVRKKRMQKVEAAVQELRETISQALGDEQTTDKGHLHDVQHKLDHAIRNLNLATLEAETFRLYAQTYPEQLQREMANKKDVHSEEVVLPLENVNDAKLNQKDMNQFVAFGYRKLKQLQEDLSIYAAAGKKSLQAALESKQAEMEKLINERYAADLANVQREMKVANAEELLDTEKKLDASHKEEVAKLMAESSQHLQEVLESQERHLRAKFETSVQELLALDRSKHQHELSLLIAKVSAIKRILSDRAEFDRLSSKSHQLWIAAQALHDELFSGDSTKHTIPVQPMLEHIISSYGDQPFVKTMASQFSNEKEVASIGQLSYRFPKVRRVCRQVATVPDPPTMTAYFWSYLRSMFVIDPPPLPIRVDSEGSKYIDASQTDTLSILTTAQELLDNNELELCVRLMNQLSGEARQVSSDWLADARRLLELRQAANALLAFAAANSAVGFLTYQGVN